MTKIGTAALDRALREIYNARFLRSTTGGQEHEFEITNYFAVRAFNKMVSQIGLDEAEAHVQYAIGSTGWRILELNALAPKGRTAKIALKLRAVDEK
jgi:hypothetical protein